MTTRTTIDRVRVSGAGIKGQAFDLDLSHPTLFCGENGAGKSARLHAIVSALNGSFDPPGLRDSDPTVLTASGPGVDIRRRLTKRNRRLEVSIGAEESRTLRDGQAIVDRHFGRTTGFVWRLGGLLDLSADKQRELLLQVAGVSCALDVDALRDRLVAAAGDQEDPSAATSFDIAALLDLARREPDTVTWAAAGRRMLGELRRSKNAELQAAKKARQRMPAIADGAGEAPAGTVQRARETVATHEATLRDLLSQQNTKAQAVARAETLRAEANRARKVADEVAAGLAVLARPEGSAPTVADARAAHAAAAKTRADAEAARDSAVRYLDEAKTLADALESGRCPYCGTSGGDLGLAVFDAQARAEDAALAAARAVEAACKAVIEQNKATAVLRSAESSEAERQRWAGLTERLSNAQQFAENSERRAADAEAALASAVDAQSDDAIEATREALAAARADLERLVEHEALLDADRRNRAEVGELERAVAAIKRLEAAVRAEEEAVLRCVSNVLCAIGNRIVPAVLGDRWALAIRVGAQATDDATAEGDDVAPSGAWQIGAMVGGEFRPIDACSTGEQAVLLVGLQFAMVSRQPYRALCVDGLVEVDPERLVFLLTVIGRLHGSGEIDAFIGALRCGPDDYDRIATALGAENVCVSYLERVTP